MYTLIELTNSDLKTKVDTRLLTVISNRKFLLGKNGYASDTASREYLHHLAFRKNHRSLPGYHIDHIDGDKLNNTFRNLQWITVAANVAKSKSYSTSTYSQYKGVTYCKRFKVWVARISGYGQAHFSNEFEAALGRDYLFSFYFPNVSFVRNVEEVRLDTYSFNVLRLKNTGSHKNPPEVWFSPAFKRRYPSGNFKWTYILNFKGINNETRTIKTSDKKEAIKWFNMLK